MYWKLLDDTIIEDEKVLVWTYYGAVMAKISRGVWHRWPDCKRMDEPPTHYMRVVGPEGR